MDQTIKSQLFGNLGIESAEAIAEKELLNVTEDDLPEDELEGETSVAEAVEDTDAVAEVESIETQADDLDTAGEDLEELDVAVESFRNAGGKLSPIESVALRVAISQVTRKFVKGSGNLVPAVESFKTDAEENTRLAHEGIKEAATAFKEGAVAAAKKALETLKKIFNDFLNRFRGIEGRANKVIVAAKAIKTDIAGDVDINKDSVSVGGSTDFAEIKGGFERLVGAVTKIKEAKTIEALSKITEETKQENEGTIKQEAIVAAQNKFMDASFKDIHGDGVTEVEGGLQAKAYPGEYHARLERPEGAFGLHYEAITRIKPEQKGGKTNVPALQPGEILTIAGAVKSLQGQVKDFKGLIARMVNALERLNSVNVGTDRGETAEDFAKRSNEEKKQARKAVSLAFGKQMTYYTKLVAMVNDVSGNMLTLCEKSVALAGKAPEEKKEEAPKAEEAKAAEA